MRPRLSPRSRSPREPLASEGSERERLVRQRELGSVLEQRELGLVQEQRGLGSVRKRRRGAADSLQERRALQPQQTVLVRSKSRVGHLQRRLSLQVRRATA